MYEVVMVWNLKLGFSVFWRNLSILIWDQVGIWSRDFLEVRIWNPISRSNLDLIQIPTSRVEFLSCRNWDSGFWRKLGFESRDFWRKSGCRKSHSNLFSSKIAWLTGTPEQILSSLFMHHHKEHWILHLSKTWIMSLSASFILRKVDHYSVFMRQTKKYIKKCHCRTSLSSSFINRSSWSEMILILYGDISKHKGLRPAGDWTG